MGPFSPAFKFIESDEAKPPQLVSHEAMDGLQSEDVHAHDAHFINHDLRQKPVPDQ